MPDDEPTVVPIHQYVDVDDEQRMLKVVKTPNPCRHQRFQLERDMQHVFCADCGVEVTAFSALEEIARSMERFVSQRQEFERRADVARRNLKELERLERNAKARLRSARKRLPECDCEHPTVFGKWCAECGGVFTAETRERFFAVRDEMIRTHRETVAALGEPPKIPPPTPLKPSA